MRMHPLSELELIAPDFIIKRLTGNAKLFCYKGEVAVILIQRLLNHLLFHVGQGLLPALRLCALGAQQKVIGLQHITIGQNHCLLHSMLQLPYIAGPVVFHKLVYGLSAQAHIILFVLFEVLLQLVAGQQLNVLPALA